MKKQALYVLIASIFISGVVIFISTLNPSLAVAQQPYYQGKTIELVVPMPAGGGTDIAARWLGRCLPKFIPGNPKVIVINKPGAGGRLGANYVYNVAREDGLTILFTAGGINLLSLLQLEGVEYDLKKMHIVTAAFNNLYFIAKGDVYKDLREIFDKELLIFGHLPAGSGSITTSFLLAKELLGFKVKKLVLAFQGSGDARRSFRAGEINATGDSLAGYKGHVRDYEKRGEVKVMMQTGVLDEEGNPVRFDPPLGHVPTVDEVYQMIYGKKPSGKILHAYHAFIGAVETFDKSLALSPGTPREVVNILADACEKMVMDPTFIKETKEKTKLTFIAGEKMRKLYKKAVIDADQEGIEWIRTWLRDEYNIQ